MSDRPERRRGETELVQAVDRLNTKLEGFREKQEKQFAIVLALQEHKTIERVDVIWETMAEMRTVWNTAKVIAKRATKFSAWGCGTLLAIAGLLVAASAAGIIHIQF